LHSKRSVCFFMNDTREYIIDEAYKLFLSRSYEAVSISDISNAIGFTKGALYHHFKNKEDLFKAVIDKYLIINELSNVSDETTLSLFIEEAIKKAKEILHGIFGEKPAYIPINYFSLAIDALRHYPGFASNKDELLNTEISKIEKILKNAIKRGEIRKDINIKLTAMNLFSLSLGVATNLLHNNSPKLAITSLKDQLFEFYKLLKK